ncbi:hypothetical protein [Nitrosococcus watsonii]|uniref:Core-binding (CB) domain-containing protein n=1 Tax=Nitrosococcus watsoni (strain C-113) TaxID=105559 RepID=D8K9B9_NITWC|nr:hypothetical protein [Nitrosococcus watsonii]ADJ29262.1 hypothetical protein Nwat_2451 [Nitrosococcus watsonii C-113]
MALTFGGLVRQHQRYIEAVTTDNTRRAYCLAIRHFERWGGRLPAETPTVRAHLLAHAETLNLRTLSLRLTALRHWHQLFKGFPIPRRCRKSVNSSRALPVSRERPSAKPRSFAWSTLLLRYQTTSVPGMVQIHDSGIKEELSALCLPFLRRSLTRSQS